MQKQQQVWQLIDRSLQTNIPVMLLYVLQSVGSSPGRAGFCMAISDAGEISGSIGGGIMEHKFVEMAKEKLKQHKQEQSIRRQVHDKTAFKDQSGMICSGEQTIFIYNIQAADADQIKLIINCLENNRKGLLQLSPRGISFSNSAPEKDFSYSFQSNEQWLYQEKLGFKNHLYIIGAGHCALALSHLFGSLSFHIHLYENRPHLHTFLKNSSVHSKSVVEDYSTVATLIPPGDNTYVVVMTVGYRTDDMVVRALMGKKIRFLGVLGSAKKIEKMFETYRAEGISEDVLGAMRAPVGLPIHSQTPEEIAISIAAQIIQVKNSDNK